MLFRRLTVPGVLLGMAIVAYAAFVRRRWVLDWGATEQERTAELPGDQILPRPSLQTTRVISIRAPNDQVWPWIVQMGPRPRAGVYTYDWLERLLGIDIENANRLLPEFQHLEPGEFLRLNSSGEGLRVVEVHPGRALVLRWKSTQSTWAFVLEPTDEGTRLISRNRIAGHGAGFWLAMFMLMEPGSLVMERKMLLGIKERAERMRVDPPARPDAG